MLNKKKYKQNESSLASQFLFTKRAHQNPEQTNKDRGQEVYSVFVLMHEVTVSFPQWQGLKLSPLDSFKETGAKEIKKREKKLIAPGNQVLGMQKEASVQRSLNQIGRMKRFP